MLTHKRHEEILNLHRIQAGHEADRLRTRLDVAYNDRHELADRANAKLVEMAKEKEALVADLNRLSAELCEAKDANTEGARVNDALRSQVNFLDGQVRAFRTIMDDREDLTVRLADAESELEIYKQREKRARNKAAKQREADKEAALEARRKAAARGEQWAVEAILNPPTLGLFR